MNLVAQGRIAPEYVPGVNQRLEFYNRLHDTQSVDAIDELTAEMVDRYGAMPEETAKLFARERIRQQLRTLRIQRVDMIRDRLTLVFDPATSARPDKMVTAAHDRGISFRFTAHNAAEVTVTGDGWAERFRFIGRFLDVIIQGAA
jgi:transcription-repair coupling factor (superfamily II helicase)